MILKHLAKENCFGMHIKNRAKKNMRIPHLAQKTRRLKSQIDTLNELVKELQKLNKTNAICSCMIKAEAVLRITS